MGLHPIAAPGVHRIMAASARCRGAPRLEANSGIRFAASKSGPRLARSFPAHCGKQATPGDLLLPLDLQSCLMEECLHANRAVNALLPQQAYQPVREGKVYQE